MWGSSIAAMTRVRPRGTALLAADGVLEINQTCAEATGCRPGDGSGFPVTISSPGNFIPTRDLEVPAGATGLYAASVAAAWSSTANVT